MPSIKKQIDCNDKTEYCSTSIKGEFQLVSCFDIMELTEDRIGDDKTLTVIVKYVFNV